MDWLEKNKKGFTLIELLIIVAIIGLLTAVILVSLNIARDKAAVNAYKTSMKAVQTGLELCWVGNGSLISGNTGVHMCSIPSEEATYPNFSTSCGPQPRFAITMSSDGNTWSVNTIHSSSSEPWDCHGCRVQCTVKECVYHETEPGDCN